MEIVPAIDIINGKCVRLTQGNFDKMEVYHDEPLEAAKMFETAGFKRLHLVDLDGAKAGFIKNLEVLNKIATNTSLAIDFGGGIKTEDDLVKVFEAGACMATIGSLAVKNENEFSQWINKYGAEKFFLGADVKNEMIVVSGWQETTAIGIYEFIEKYLQKGLQQIFCTDVNKDGKLEGPATMLYRRIFERFPGISLVASGGVSSIEDVHELKQVGCKGVIIGKAIYENAIKLEELINFNK